MPRHENGQHSQEVPILAGRADFSSLISISDSCYGVG